jgi:quercetin dioxygenase-like cupin family protein
MGRFAPSLLSALTLAVTMSATVPAMAQQATPATTVATPATTVTALLKQALTDVPGREVMVITLDIPPGGGSPPHRHPGHHVFGYVLEGSYKLKLDQGDEKILTKGQTFYEAPGQLHAVSGNASQTEPAKVLAFIVAESGKPITVPEKQ